MGKTQPNTKTRRLRKTTEHGQGQGNKTKGGNSGKHQGY